MVGRGGNVAGKFMDKNDIFKLLEQARRKRAHLKGITNAVRLVNGFGDELDGLILEQYDRHYIVQVLDEQWLKHCQLITDFVKDTCAGEYLVIKNRTASASAVPGAIQSTVWLDSGSSCTVVEEHGLKFGVDCNDTLNSGLFLDMRANRVLVSALAAQRKVLNLFSYTCSFGVYCRARGAAAVVNVDVGRKSLERARHNYELNGLVPAQNEFIRADAVEYLQRAVKKDNRFDMIIIDPPSFARFDGKSFSVKKDLAPLVMSAMKVLNPDGVLLVASNYTDMTHDSLEDMIRDAADARNVQTITRLGQDEDFIGSGLMLESYLAAVLACIG